MDENMQGKVGLDISAFKSGIAALNREVQVYSSGLKAASSGMDNWGNSSDSLKAKLDNLTKTAEAHQKKIDLIRQRYQALEQEENKNTAALQRLQIHLNNETAALNATQKEIDQTTTKLRQMESGLANVGKKLTDTAPKIKEFGKKLTDFGKSMTTYVTLPIVAAGTAAVKLASDVTESTNKVDVAFGDSADSVKAWADTTLKSFGLAKGTALDMAALFGDMGTAMGQTTSEASTMSKSLVELAADMASFKNVKIEVAQNALKGIFTGEGESLKSLGVVMQESTLEAYALSKGMEKSYKEMSQAEKVTLRYKFVIDATKNAQGDFARTSDSMANQTRIAQESIKELGAEIGEELLPIVVPLLKKINEWIQSFTKLDSGTKQTILTIAGLAAAVGPATVAIGTGATAISSITSLIGTLSTKIAAAGGAFTVMSGPVGWIIALIGALALGVGTLGMRMGEGTKKAKEFAAACEASADAFDDQIAKTNTQTVAAQKLSDELFDLAEKEKLSNNEKIQMKALVAQLNSLMPELSLKIDEQTGKLLSNRDAVDELIKKRKEEITLQAYSETMLQLQKDMVEVQIKINDAVEKENAAQAKLKDSYNGTVYLLKLLNGEYDDAVKEHEILEEESRKLSYRYETLMTTYKDAVRSMSEDDDALADSAEESRARMWYAEDRYQDKLEEGTAAQQRATVEREAALMTDADRTESIHQQINAIRLQMDADAKTAEDERLKLLKEHQQAVEQATQTHMDQMGELDDRGIQKSRLTAKQIKKNLEQQIKDFEAWRADIKAISSRVPDDVLNELRALGPEQSKLIDDLSKMSDKDLAAFVTVWQQKGAAAKTAAEDELGKVEGASTAAGKKTVDSLAAGLSDKSGQTSVSTAASALTAIIAREANTLPALMYAAGKNSGMSLASGLSSTESTIRKAVSQLAKSILKQLDADLEIKSPSKATRARGVNTGRGYVLGIMEWIPQALQASTYMAKAAVAGLSNATIQPRFNMGGISLNRGGGTPTSGGTYREGDNYYFQTSVPVSMNGQPTRMNAHISDSEALALWRKIKEVMPVEDKRR